MGYSEKYLDHFTNPRGIGEISEPDLFAEAAHEGGGCFDRVKLTVKLSANRVADAKFRARACSGTIAACSALTELMLGKNVDELSSMTTHVLIDYLGGIPDKKLHSVELAIQVLNKAIESSQNKVDSPND